jgi:hypothetical protein
LNTRTTICLMCSGGPMSPTWYDYNGRSNKTFWRIMTEERLSLLYDWRKFPKRIKWIFISWYYSNFGLFPPVWSLENKSFFVDLRFIIWNPGILYAWFRRINNLD